MAATMFCSCLKTACYFKIKIAFIEISKTSPKGVWGLADGKADGLLSKTENNLCILFG